VKDVANGCSELGLYRLALIEKFVLPATEPAITFGQKLAASITVNDIEAYRASRRKQQLPRR